MTPINELHLTGQLGSEPLVKVFEGGNKMVSVSLCTTEEIKRRNGEIGLDTQWHYITGWGDIAEAMALLHNGAHVYVKCRIAQRTHTDKTGVRRFAVEIIVNELTEIKNQLK